MIMKNNDRKFKRIFIILSVLLIANVVIITYSWSAIGIRMEKESLANEADLIVVGTVKDKYTEDIKEEGFYTFITFSVDEYIKGYPVNEVVIKQFGGTIGNKAIGIPGMPGFSIGERVLVFLKYFDDDGYYRVVEAAQGKFSIVKDPDSGRETLKRDLSGLHFINWQHIDSKIYFDDYLKSLRK